MTDEVIPFIKEARDVEVLEEQYLTSPALKVKQGYRKKYIDADGIQVMISRIKEPKHKMLFTFMWMSGCRTSEVIGLKKNDIDFDRKEITIRWLKSRKSKNRIIPIHSSLCKILEVYSSGMKYDERIFPYTRQGVHFLSKRYFNESPHTIRHSFAVNFLRQSDSPHALVTLKRLLGHGRIETTMVYLDIVPTDQAKLLEKIKF